MIKKEDIESKIEKIKRLQEEVRQEIQKELLGEIKKLYEARKFFLKVRSIDQSGADKIDRMLAGLGIDILSLELNHWESSTVGCGHGVRLDQEIVDFLLSDEDER
jgi:hypothetical protein